MSTVTAVVVYHSDLDRLGPTLQSLCDAGCDELLVVDVSSAQNASVVANEFGGIVIRAPENRGYGWACNIGIARASCEMVLISNADVIYAPAALREMCAVLGALPGLVAPVQFASELGRVALATESLQLGISVGDSLNRWLGLGRRRMKSHKQVVLSALERDGLVELPCCFTLSGAAMMAARPTWAQLGGFDESFFLYQEDADLTVRARQEGLGVWLCGRAGVIHAGGTRQRGVELFALRAAISSERAAWSKHGLDAKAIKWIQAVGIATRFGASCLRRDRQAARVWKDLISEVWSGA